MPIPSPFHASTAACCRSLRWKDWAGYYAVCAFDTYPEREYFAFRHSAGVIDVSPLFKFEIHGPDAAALLSRVTVRNIGKLKLGQIVYCCWCDEFGKVVDDGTVMRLGEAHFRMTANEPSVAWLTRYARGLNVQIEDSSARIAVLSVQGPQSRDVLRKLVDFDVDALKFFRCADGRVGGLRAMVSRTGYTGDRGYEIWVEPDDAGELWDLILDAGQPFGALPCGLDAMDITRIEAGFILANVDYYNANHCLIEPRKSTPFELGFDWMVDLDRAPFNGQAALLREKEAGPARRLVGLDISWEPLEKLYAEHGLPPEICPAAWRTAVPVYDGLGRHIGQATSGAWSPTLKKNLALATVEAGFSRIGTVVQFEVTVEYQRRTVPATVVRKPFFDPPRKRT